MMEDLPSMIAAELRGSAKYRDLCDQTIGRIAADAARRHAKPADAVKAAKRKLHQVFAAYCDQPSLKHLLADVEAMPMRSADPVEFEKVAQRLLSQHASTAERSAEKATLYARLWEVTGVPYTVLDLACGYHPFSLPWMGLGPSTRYHAFDIDKRLVTAIGLFLRKANQPGHADCGDLLVDVPRIPADVALLFKTLPVLEQQEKDAAVKILRAIPARHIIVSFPLRTLGGRDVGMAETYEQQMQRISMQVSLRAKPMHLRAHDEMFFVLSPAQG